MCIVKSCRISHNYYRQTHEKNLTVLLRLNCISEFLTVLEGTWSSRKQKSKVFIKYFRSLILGSFLCYISGQRSNRNGTKTNSNSNNVKNNDKCSHLMFENVMKNVSVLQWLCNK